MSVPDRSCQYLTDVISDIISAVHRLSPQLAAGTYIVHPPKMSDSEDITAPPPKELYPVEGIRRSIRGNEEFALSLKDTKDDCNMVAITDLFGGCIPSLKDVERISWPQPDPCRPELDQLQPDVLLQTVYSECTADDMTSSMLLFTILHCTYVLSITCSISQYVTVSNCH